MSTIVAIVGRPNVGKSTLINNLCNRKELAKVSDKPGKTQLINYHLQVYCNWPITKELLKYL